MKVNKKMLACALSLLATDFATAGLQIPNTLAGENIPAEGKSGKWFFSFHNASFQNLMCTNDEGFVLSIEGGTLTEMAVPQLGGGTRVYDMKYGGVLYSECGSANFCGKAYRDSKREYVSIFKYDAASKVFTIYDTYTPSVRGYVSTPEAIDSLLDQDSDYYRYSENISCTGM